MNAKIAEHVTGMQIAVTPEVATRARADQATKETVTLAEVCNLFVCRLFSFS